MKKSVRRNAAKNDVESEDSSMEVDEEFSPPASKKRTRKGAVKNTEDSPSSVKENTPVNTKQSKRKAGKAKVSTQTRDTDSDEDMFASPSHPVLKTKKYSDTGSQTSPAFVAASKAARKVGQAALAKSEGKVTPRKKSALEETSVSDSGIDNPTPAMAAILQKRQAEGPSKKVSKTKSVSPATSTEILTPAMQAIIQKRQAAEEAGSKRKKPTSATSSKKTKM